MRFKRQFHQSVGRWSVPATPAPGYFKWLGAGSMGASGDLLLYGDLGSDIAKKNVGPSDWPPKSSEAKTVRFRSHPLKF